MIFLAEWVMRERARRTGKAGDGRSNGKYLRDHVTFFPAANLISTVKLGIALDESILFFAEVYLLRSVVNKKRDQHMQEKCRLALTRNFL